MKGVWLIGFALFALNLKGEAGLASWYGEEHRGRLMANGKPFQPEAMTCASWHYAFGTRLRVSHENKSVVVTVTDRGPSRRFKDRLIDLSAGAYRKLAPLATGLTLVEIQREP